MGDENEFPSDDGVELLRLKQVSGAFRKTYQLMIALPSSSNKAFT